MPMGGSVNSGYGGGGLGAVQGIAGIGNSFNWMDKLKSLGDFMSGSSGQGLMGLGSLALQGYGLNKSMGFAEDQMGILKDQENRAATAQNYGTGNSLSLALQNTTPGTPEHERIKQAIAEGTYGV